MVDNLTYFAFPRDAILRPNNVKNIITFYSFIKFNFSTKIYDFLISKIPFRLKKSIILDIRMGKINLNAE